MDFHENVVDFLRKKDWKVLAAEAIFSLSNIEATLNSIDESLKVIAQSYRGKINQW